MRSLLSLWLFLSKTPGREATAALKYQQDGVKMSVLVQKTSTLNILNQHHRETFKAASEVTTAARFVLENVKAK